MSLTYLKFKSKLLKESYYFAQYSIYSFLYSIFEFSASNIEGTSYEWIIRIKKFAGKVAFQRIRRYSG